ncbi:MAG TPA: Gfo/Idh/MocA family oxidoreductase, partial [Terriglobia bacterium]|nr:Gfo/Idh/MocA family oxidoreductase [Terriglobia bacterium]
MVNQLKMGMVGTGFMGRAHSNAYRRVNQFFNVAYEPVMKAVAARSKDKTEAFAKRWGWERVEDDWRKLIDAPDIDVIDICSPNNTHYEIAMAAAQKGKIVLCEKPLAINLAQAREMTQAVEKSGKPNMVWFNYRRVPAISLAKQVIDEGRLGRIFHYRATYLQDWTISPKVPVGGAATWRLEKEVAGAGVSGDLSAHNIDTALWLNGSISRVLGMTEIFIRNRQRPDGTPASVEIDDVCTFLAQFQNGSNGTFE